MSSPASTRRPAIVVMAALVLALVGCSPAAVAGDKAGAAGEPPLTLKLASPDSEGTPGTEVVKHFADEVSSRSGGRITIEFRWNAAGSVTDVEGEVIRQVHDGEQDLGWVGTRAWDGQGITGFSALQAPFLIADYGTLHAVMTSDVPGRMFAELDGLGLIGLSLYPDQLRHPLGFREPFLTLEDFQGAEIRVPNSELSDAILGALGAVPAHLNGDALGEALDSGELVGAETSTGNASSLPQGGYMTMNVTFYPKVQTLFVASDRFAELSEATRSVLQASADETLTWQLTQDPEAADVEVFCELGGTLVNAEPDELERMVAATDSVRQEMETDAVVAELIGAIEDLRATAPTPELMTCPS